MRAEGPLTGADPASGIPWQEAIATDLSELAVLHDRELDGELIAGLHAVAFPEGLGLRLTSDRGREALALMAAGLGALSTQPDQGALDDLAADYAAIYLTYNLRASPCESVWTDPEGLMMQESAFQVRDWYRAYGLGVEDWRKRADDHLVCQLQFLAQLLRISQGQAEALSAAARFLDEHLLRWIDGFALRVAKGCATPFYGGLAVLTAAYLDELRELLVRLTGEPRPTPAEVEERMRTKGSVAVAAPGPYVPGTGPSW